jgi:F-box protein 9
VADATAEVPPLTVHVHKNKHRRPSKPLSGPSTNANDDEDEEAPELSVDGATIGSPPKQAEDIVGFGSVKAGKAPRTALEHYEKAVEKESQGSLGDSLNLYRKAFRVRHKSRS